jgi:hypothetical protein
VLGEITREEFMIKFTGAGKVYMHHFQDFLFATYERKSFPETFFHPQIAQALCATGKLSDPNTIQQRITETGAIMVASLDKKKGLGIMLGLAKSHERRNQNLYNEDGRVYAAHFFLLRCQGRRHYRRRVVLLSESCRLHARPAARPPAQ